MSRNGLIAISALTFVPGFGLTIVLAMALLRHAERMGVAMYLPLAASLTCSLLLTLFPFGLVLFYPKIAEKDDELEGVSGDDAEMDSIAEAGVVDEEHAVAEDQEPGVAHVRAGGKDDHETMVEDDFEFAGDDADTFTDEDEVEVDDVLDEDEDEDDFQAGEFADDVFDDEFDFDDDDKPK